MNERKRSKRHRHFKRTLARAIAKAEREAQHKQVQPRATMVCGPSWLWKLPK